jgi:hypothetical protein
VTWECAECHAIENREIRIDGICHHCGKLLCRADQEVIPDLAFAAASGEIGAEAVHCRSCKRRHHRRIDVSLGTSGQ